MRGSILVPAHPSPYSEKRLDPFRRFAGLTIAYPQHTQHAYPERKRERPRYICSSRPHLTLRVLCVPNIADHDPTPPRAITQDERAVVARAVPGQNILGSMALSSPPLPPPSLPFS